MNQNTKKSISTFFRFLNKNKIEPFSFLSIIK